ncbi:hypothetical protein B0T22DRAFT_455243 [Podospora appendiculata]|uniref:Secreted protein n=1 Tax=Podospora appendiculata TaxID=314037 RepID=A0AAE0XLL2_9PEZI|nr:hypothetical protein B0T22DRAFT_455243 [Podospora appendiculata]
MACAVQYSTLCVLSFFIIRFIAPDDSHVGRCPNQSIHLFFFWQVPRRIPYDFMAPNHHAGTLCPSLPAALWPCLRKACLQPTQASRWRRTMLNRRCVRDKVGTRQPGATVPPAAAINSKGPANTKRHARYRISTRPRKRAMTSRPNRPLFPVFPTPCLLFPTPPPSRTPYAAMAR